MKLKKYVLFSLSFMFLLICSGCKRSEGSSQPTINFLDKCAYETVDDNWIYYFCASYFKDQDGNFTVLNEYDFNGFDLLKKDTSDEFGIPVVDGDTGKIIEYYDSDVNSLLYGKKTREDTNKITDYFNSSNFNYETLKDDLNKLDLKYIDADLVINLYEKSLHAPEKKFGKYGSLPFVGTIDKEISNGTIRIGYILNYGNIEYIKIDFIDKNGEFLSDLVEEKKATNEQIDDYNEILKLEDEIINKQELEIDIKYEGKYFSFTSLSQMLKGLNDN